MRGIRQGPEEEAVEKSPKFSVETVNTTSNNQVFDNGERSC